MIAAVFAAGVVAGLVAGVALVAVWLQLAACSPRESRGAFLSSADVVAAHRGGRR